MTSKREPVKMQETWDPVDADTCRWKGKPVLLPYLLINGRLLSMTAMSILVYWYWYVQFQWIAPTIIWMVFYGFSIIGGIVKWSRVSYYITDTGPCVRRKGISYQHSWQDIRLQNCRTIKNPLYLVFGCRTIQFAIEYGYGDRGSNTNLLRETGRFWCIRDFERVEAYIRRYVN